MRHSTWYRSGETGDTKKAGLASHFVTLFKEDGMNSVRSLFLENFRAEMPEPLPHQVWIVIVNSRLIMAGCVPTLSYFDAAFSDIEEVSSVAGPGP